MIDSILDSIKKAVGLGADYDAFDHDIMMHINSSFAELQHVGAAPVDGFEITSAEEVWTDYTKNLKVLNMVKSFIYLNVRLIFDPPTTSFAVTAMTKQAEEYKWRLSICDHLFEEGTVAE